MNLTLIMILAGLLAIDEVVFSGVFSRPLVACTLTGLLCGNISTGMVVGATMEGLFLSFEETSFYSLRRGCALPAVLYTALAASEVWSVNVSLSLVIILVLVSIGVSALLTNLNMLFLPPARKAAEKGNGKALGLYTVISLVIRFALFAIVAGVLFSKGEELQNLLTSLQLSYSWIFSALSAASVLVSCVGFAVLLRNLTVKEIPGALFAGIGFGCLFALLKANMAGLVASACIAYALYTYELKKDGGSADAVKKEKKVVKGDDEQWW